MSTQQTVSDLFAMADFMSSLNELPRFGGMTEVYVYPLGVDPEDGDPHAKVTLFPDRKDTYVDFF